MRKHLRNTYRLRNTNRLQFEKLFTRIFFITQEVKYNLEKKTFNAVLDKVLGSFLAEGKDPFFAKKNVCLCRLVNKFRQCYDVDLKVPRLTRYQNTTD